MNNYGIDIWANGDFIIDKDVVKINYKSKPSIYEIVTKIRDNGLKGPLLLRFPHLIEKQIDSIYKNFETASKTLNYKGNFQALFPLKVNQFPNFIMPLLKIGEKYKYGLEAGSKAELLLAISLTKKDSPIFVNGFKDQEMIKLAFLSAQMEHDITLTLEGIDELKSMLDVAKEEKNLTIPKIALRIKLHSSGIGIWAKSGGYNSKFGLTSTELLMAIKLLKKNNLLDKFTMIHFHIGSQLNDIAPLKKALREAGNIYADLKKLGAYNLATIDIGGGLGVEYSQHKEQTQTHYSLAEYANDIIFMIQTIAKSKNVKEPNIAIESGRFIAASHAILIAPVFELFSEEYNESELNLKETNPPLIEELVELYKGIDKKHALEYLHDSVDHLNSILTLFDLGYVDLIDRSNSEILVNLIVKKVIKLLENEHTSELLKFKDSLLEKYLINFSIFQSMPDFWGLKQNFPVMPITKLNTKPTRGASLWDISCDSDGEIEFDRTNPLFLHSVNTDEEDYFLAFFLVGAYQEILGMKHNLFVHPTEATIIIDDNSYQINNLKISPSIMEILDDIDYDTQEIIDNLLKNINNSKLIEKEDRVSTFKKLETLFKENGYLKTVN